MSVINHPSFKEQRLVTQQDHIETERQETQRIVPSIPSVGRREARSAGLGLSRPTMKL